MEILHVSAECYPMAKAGGLADVVGALPKYQNRLGHVAKVVMPMHRTKFLLQNKWDVVHKGSFNMGLNYYDFTIIKERTNKLGFDLYCIDIYGLLDREKIYSYPDDAKRFTAFQIAVCEWLNQWQHRPDVVHVHDHHAALIPFFMQQCFAFDALKYIKTVLTIHNGQYQGWMGWEEAAGFPAWNTWRWGLLDWKNMINPLAAGIKCAHAVTTVSQGYMEELRYEANGLESLISAEYNKCKGIINGIDYEVWDPATDEFISRQFSSKTVSKGKGAIKQNLCSQFDLDKSLPLFIFIGRLVGEKAADLLPAFIERAFENYGYTFSILILGSGDLALEQALSNLQYAHVGFFNARMEYNEKLSHEMYAGADFLLMPSRVEPCGLNQLYAMRYGTVPMVRKTGGLKDTVKDFGDAGGYGITFEHASVDDMMHALHRAGQLFADTDKLNEIRKTMMALNTNWEESANQYINLYSQ